MVGGARLLHAFGLSIAGSNASLTPVTLATELHDLVAQPTSVIHLTDITSSKYVSEARIQPKNLQCA